MCFFCLVSAMPLCASVYMCLVVTCWERADLLVFVCGVLLWVCHFPFGFLGQVWYMMFLIPELCTLTYFGRPHIPNATYKVPRSLAFWFWRRFLKGFYHKWAWRPSWSCDQIHLSKLLFPVIRSLHMNCGFNWSSGFRGDDVWKCCRTTDDGVIGILLANPWAFGSGELKVQI